MTRDESLPGRESVVGWLLGRARDAPDRLAYAVGDARVTYGALLEQVRAVANGLSARGVARGGRVVVVLPTCLDCVRVVYGAQAVGAAPLAMNPALPADTIARRLRMVRADVAVAPPDTCARLRVSLGASACQLVSTDDLRRMSSSPTPRFTLPSPDEVALFQFTSGTTGEPRVTVTLHRQLAASIAQARERLEIRPSDVFATWVPLHHSMGLVRFVLSPMTYGCPSHLVPASIANLAGWLATLSRVRATVTASSDCGYRLAARIVRPQALELDSLRFATNGGETVRASTIDSFEGRFGLKGVIRPAYGLAEATLGVTCTAPGEPVRIDASGTVSCGRPYRGIEVQIAAPDGSFVPPGTDGEIAVAGETVFAGYLDDPEASREVLRDGWLHTGDVGAVDADGYLFVKGRARALIKRGGSMIAPREIEEAVDGIDGIDASAAFGVSRASATASEEVAVVAEIRLGAEAAWMARMAERVGREVVRAIGIAPGVVYLVAPGTIPRTPAGKTRYQELRRLVETGALGSRLLFGG